MLTPRPRKNRSQRPRGQASISTTATAELEREGVQSFCDSYRELLDCIEGKLGVLCPAGGARPG